ncbi:MAG: YgiT-type zinc finger protein [Fibrobacterota bacterium]
MKTKQKSETAKAIRSYWRGETCEICGGAAITDRKVELYRHRSGKRVLFEGVPAGVCSDCGTRYFTANTAKMLEEKLTGKARHSPGKRVTIPVLSF